jgi:hypothetical protein
MRSLSVACPDSPRGLLRIRAFVAMHEQDCGAALPQSTEEYATCLVVTGWCEVCHASITEQLDRGDLAAWLHFARAPGPDAAAAKRALLRADYLAASTLLSESEQSVASSDLMQGRG